MMRISLSFILIGCLFLPCLSEAKKHNESKIKKAQKEESNIEKNSAADENSEEREQDFMRKATLSETSLPGAAVAQNSLPAATKESDALKTRGSVDEEDDVESGENDDVSGSGEQAKIGGKDDNNPSKVKSHVLVEKDKNKIAETVKKSKVIKNRGKQRHEAEGKNQSKTTNGKAKQDKAVATKKSKNDSPDKNEKREAKKRWKESHHHHHHHHHHRQKQEKKNKRPKVENEANKPKVDYPTFNWTKDGKKVNKVAQIPGWGSSGAPAVVPAQGGQIVPMVQVPGTLAGAPAGLIQRDSVPMSAQNLLNSTIRNQADIASLDQASVSTDQSSQRDQTKPKSSKEQSANDNSTVDATKNPVAATVATDTGEVPSGLTKKLDLKIPSSIPSRCTSLVKSYTNAEITLRDYLKQLRKCKKADADFNAMHPNGVAMLRDAISKNGPYLTKEAYKYALERVRNYVPSSKEKEAADMILAKWRTNSFGNRDKVSANGEIPDAIKSFMTGQTSDHDKAQENERKIEEQTQKAIETAKSYILGTITGRTGDLHKGDDQVTPPVNADKKAAIATSTKQSVFNVINAAKSLLSGDDKGHAIVLTSGNKSPAIVPLPDVKKQQIANPATNKAKALKMAETANALNAAMMSQLSPNVVTTSEKVSSNLLAALRDMGSGPESSLQPGIKPSVQKRNAVTAMGFTRKRRSLPKDYVKRYKKINLKLKRRRKRQMREKPFEIDNPSERSKLNKPIIPAPKLMDKIRDMSMVIATP